MDTVTLPELDSSELVELIAVLEWRFSRLVRGGYGSEDAVVLATHPEIDLHRATALVARGCPPETAVRILI